MKKIISFPHVEQFRTVVSEVKRRTNFVGVDADNEPIYIDHVQPVITFEGTVKIDGTNASVAYNEVDGIWYQSRERMITVGDDNYGFAAFADPIQDTFITMIKDVANDFVIDLSVNTIVIYGEWAGKGIQAGVAVAELPRAFYIFGLKVIPFNDLTEEVSWLSSDNELFYAPYYRVFNIYQYGSYSIDIDFNTPADSLKQLEELTNKVVEECPCAKAQGITGQGEGIVWTANHLGHNYRFKTKSEATRPTKTKSMVSIDPEKAASIQEFILNTVTITRVDQAISRVFGSEPIDIKRMSEVIKWTVNDILTEEADVINASGLDRSMLGKNLPAAVVILFKAKLNEY